LNRKYAATASQSMSVSCICLLHGKAALQDGYGKTIVMRPSSIVNPKFVPCYTFPERE